MGGRPGRGWSGPDPEPAGLRRSPLGQGRRLDALRPALAAPGRRGGPWPRRHPQDQDASISPPGPERPGAAEGEGVTGAPA